MFLKSLTHQRISEVKTTAKHSLNTPRRHDWDLEAPFSAAPCCPHLPVAIPGVKDKDHMLPIIAHSVRTVYQLFGT